MTREQAKMELMSIYGSLSSNKQIAIDTLLEQEPTVQDKQAESEKYQKAFDDGYANGYAQARFDYEQEPCDDAISRREALKCLNGAWGDYSVLNEVFERIDKLPSVTLNVSWIENSKGERVALDKKV